MELNRIIYDFLNLQPEEFSVKPITDGLINATFLIEDVGRNKKFILQKINTEVFKQPENIVENHLRVNEHLRKNGYNGKTVQLIKTQSGDYLSMHNGAWRMQEFVPECSTFLKVPNAETAYKAAKTFSSFYSALNQNPDLQLKESIPGFLDFRKRISDFHDVLKAADENFRNRADKEIQFICHHIHLADRWLDLEDKKKMPERIIHADPKISNILFTQENIPLAVIDLDTVMKGSLLYDFGDMIRSYTNKTDEDDGKVCDNFDSEIFDSVKRGFLEHLESTLSETELKHLNDAAETVIFIQAMRFLTDYLAGSVYYQTSYPHHNLARTKNQINLLKGLQNYLH